MNERTDRIAGMLFGLAAGDKIGGPVRMALRVADSLLACGTFDVRDVGLRYLDWWRDGAFDTGPTAAAVLEMVDAGRSFDDAATVVDQRLGGKTAGCNPAHRSVAIAACSSVSDSDLDEAANAEARLTHKHPLSGDVAAAVVRLCRSLINGLSWQDSLSFAATGRQLETVRALDVTSTAAISADGFAPNVLRAAVHFVNSSESFHSALVRSVEFAGLANYCPVLVGSIAGARWGRSCIGDDVLRHQANLLAQLERTSVSLAETWTTKR
ncbi:MAG: ADP-ribosylglycohydrolase family protein [Planctomycetaceae bacterium]|nr:ADP-ribosylglycohydrolase family protein [Planctomycetaceae bacterium]